MTGARRPRPCPVCQGAGRNPHVHGRPQCARCSGAGQLPPAHVVHVLKCDPAPFAALRRGLKVHEYRFNDRDYHEGDTLVLREWRRNRQADDDGEGPEGVYTGQETRRRITYVGTGYGIPEGYVVLSLAACEHDAEGMAAEVEAIARECLVHAEGCAPESGDRAIWHAAAGRISAAAAFLRAGLNVPAGVD